MGVSKVTQDSPYKASLTRERFLFREMRTTAKLLQEGLTEAEVIKKIIEDNLFQYPTEKSVKRMAGFCITRLKAMEDGSLIKAIANEPAEVSKQICLYAMMKQSRLVWDFMITIIGKKFREHNLTFGKIDLNVFFMNLQEQDDAVASWSDRTIQEIKQLFVHILVENGYLDSTKSTELKPVWLETTLKNAILASGETTALAAFNYFE